MLLEQTLSKFPATGALHRKMCASPEESQRAEAAPVQKLQPTRFAGVLACYALNQLRLHASTKAQPDRA